MVFSTLTGYDSDELRTAITNDSTVITMAVQHD